MACLYNLSIAIHFEVDSYFERTNQMQNSKIVFMLAWMRYFLLSPKGSQFYSSCRRVMARAKSRFPCQHPKLGLQSPILEIWIWRTIETQRLLWVSIKVHSANQPKKFEFLNECECDFSPFGGSFLLHSVSLSHFLLILII